MQLSGVELLLSAITPAIISASVAIVVAVLAPAFTALQRRRDDVHARFDEALAALLTVQAARHIATGIARRYHPGNEDEYRRFQLVMSEDSIRHFVLQTVAAREALSKIAAYVPEARGWITAGWELTEEKEPEQRDLIERRRAQAVRTERLFRSRGVVASPVA